MHKKIFFGVLSCLLATTLIAGRASVSRGYNFFSWINPDEKPALVKEKNKIPLDPGRWYQMNHTAAGLQGLFDGITNRKVETGYGKVLHQFEAYYPLLEGEQMTIESILLYDGEGQASDVPFTLWVINDKWQRTKVATFTGEKYKSWVGPAGSTDNFNLALPLKNPRYLVISTASFYPTELELYGPYTAPKKLASPSAAALAQRKKVKFKQTTGVNAFEWDFEDPANPGVLDEVRWQAIRNFSGIRHYLDWERLEPREGQYTFNPARLGGWNYDVIYQNCKTAGIEVLACLKTLPSWLSDTYPEDQRDKENVPVKFGRDLLSPASYLEQARLGFQFAARYGHNKNLDPALVKVSREIRWNGDSRNEVKIGLGLIRYIENENERDKWWKGRKAYQTGREYAANLSAFYDGHKNTLGPGVGVKNADPGMQVVMAGLAHPSTEYVQGMIDWCREFRGYNADGQVDLCWDVINYHLYANDAQSSQGGKASRGAAPEVSGAGKVARDFIRFAHQNARGMPVWITETGYDLHPGSPFKAMPIGNKSAAQTQADWILRSSLLYARSGVERVFFYQLVDDHAGHPGQFSTSGLINQDRTKRPAAAYLSQVRELLGEYAYQETIHQDPIIDRYAQGSKTIYAVVVPDEKGREGQVTLNLGTAPYAYIYRPQAGKDHLAREKRSTQNGRLPLTATETPLFVQAINSKQ